MRSKLLLACSLLTAAANAQSFKNGQLDLNLGIGLGNTFIGSGYTTSVPALSLAVDYGVTDAISIGGYIGYTKAKWEYSGTGFCNSGNGVGNFIYTYTDTYEWTYTIIGARGAYHFTSLVANDHLDLYAGLMLGDNIASSSVTSVTTPFCDKHDVVFLGQTYGGVILSGFIGARYRFNDHLGIFGELGYGITFLNIGVHCKF